MKKVYIDYLGCYRRALDASLYETYFIRNHCRIVSCPKKADLILLLTCAFNQVNEDISIKRIAKLCRYNARIIVGGCLKGINEKRLYQNFSGTSFTPADGAYLDHLFPEFQIKLTDIEDAHFTRPKRFEIIRHYLFAFRFDFNFIKRVWRYLSNFSFAKPYFIRIGWGCVPEHCAYCVIWRAIGKLHSKPLETCLREFECGAAKGHKLIRLVADNLGAYGMDIGIQFPDLLARMLNTQGNYRLQLWDYHPFYLIRDIDKLAELLKSGKIALFHIPLQSGSDRILKTMNRRHTISELSHSLHKVKHAFPSVKITTDIILGFPGETENDFKQTLDFTQQTMFDFVYVYRYSENPYLHSPETAKGRIPEEVKTDRVKRAVRFLRKNKITCSTA